MTAASPSTVRGVLPKVTLVTGPVRSGKSRHAEQLLAAEPRVTYVAAGRIPDGSDPEWAQRVATHQADRPTSWTTVELGPAADLCGAIRASDSPVLVDCLGTWLTAVIDGCGWEDLRAASHVVAEHRAGLLDVLAGSLRPVVLVTNEVGWSLVATTPGGRFFRDELGRLNAAVADLAARVHLVVVGRVLDLSESLRVGHA